MPKLISIHDLRGVAALAVLVFHAFVFVDGYGSGEFMPDYVRVGRAGVAKVLTGRVGGREGDIVMLVAAMAAALVAAALFHHLVERPALRLASALARRRTSSATRAHAT